MEDYGYPVSEEYIRTENGRIFARVSGKGNPVLMIHGVGSDADYFKDSVPMLADCHKVITYDRNGNSRSTPFAGADFSIRGELEDVRAVLDLAGEDKIVIVGVSSGSFVALKAALDYPERISRLVLYEPAFCFTKSSVSRMGAFKEKIGRMAAEGKIAAAILSFVDMIGGLDPDSPPVSAQQQIANYENFRFYLTQQLKHFSYGPDYIDELKELKVPCHILAGDKDRDGLFYRTARETAQVLGVCPVVVDGYHNYPKDHPKDFVKIVQNFL